MLLSALAHHRVRNEPETVRDSARALWLRRAWGILSCILARAEYDVVVPHPTPSTRHGWMPEHMGDLLTMRFDQ